MPPPKHKRSTDEVFNEPQRLHKVLASCGFGSRRAMEEMILAGRITVNRQPAEVGQKVGPGDEVRINGDLVKVRFAEPRARILMYHKPAGELVTRDDPEGRPTVFEKLPSIGQGKWINIGRLDYNTEGLLLFTNSGELANRMMHPRFEVEREYAVRIMGRLGDEQAQRLTAGIELEDGLAKVDSVEDAGGDDDVANHWYKVVLHEGRNREVRRLFEALGLMVSRLIRTRYGVVAMPTVLKRGDILELEAGEVMRVLDAAGLKAGSGPNGKHPGKRPQGQKGARPGHGARPGGRPHGGPRGHGAREGQAERGQRGPHGQGGHGQGQHAGQGRGGQGHGGQGHGGHGHGGQGHAGQGQRGGPGQRGAQGPRGGRGHGGQGPHAGQGQPGAHARGGPGGMGPGAQRRGAKRGFGKGPRPQGPAARQDYDERQPTSNANASPFGRTTLTIPGGMPLGRPEGDGGHGGPGARNARPGRRGPGQGKGGRAQGKRARGNGVGVYVGNRREAPPLLDPVVTPVRTPKHVPVVARKRHRNAVLPGTEGPPRDDGGGADDKS